MKNKPLTNTYTFMALITGLLITVSYSAELDQPKKIEIQKAPIAPKKSHANSAGRYMAVTGDSYSRIAKQCNVDERALRALNDNVNLRPGVVLDLPAVSEDLRDSTYTIYVDAVDNCIGPEGGAYKSIRVDRNATYQLSIKKANAVFNKYDGAKFVNIGVGYVEPPRKMMIKTIELGKRTYVKSEGALWFFLVDDAGLNKGGFEIEVKKISASKPYIVTLANLKELKLKKKEALQRGSLIEATAYDEELIKMAFILAGETPGASLADKKLRPSDLEEMGLLNRTVFIESSVTKRFLFSDGKSLKGEGRKAIEMMRGAEGGWVNHVEHGNFNVVGSDANYYNRAGWVIKQSGDAFILENIETKRYLLSDGKPTDGRRGNEGGLLDCFGNNNSNVVGADANYLDRALWDIYKIGGDFIFESKATKRYLFSDGEPIKGKRGVEGSWRHSPNVIGADANYENRAFWKISPQKKG